MQRNRKNVIKTLGIVTLAILFITVIGFVIWASTPLGPMPEAVEALTSDDFVQVSSSPWYTFDPKTMQATTGFIIYPGGRVDPRSYAPLAKMIAMHGYKVVIVPMPLNLAVFDPDRAKQVISKYPEIDHWFIGGHSLGGAMTANFANNNSDILEGLIFLAAYPAESDNLSTKDIPVQSIYATNDGLSTLEKIEATENLLPPTTQWVEIQGGNHAQFGWYGDQPGDMPANISREEQQNLIFEAIFLFFRQILEKSDATTGLLTPTLN